MSDENNDKKTPLYDLHLERGGKMVSFAGYSLPVQYEMGILKEHLHCREKAGLFDVSHMGQAYVHGRGGDPARALEAVMPGLLTSLKPGKMRYSLLLNEAGGIEDDLIVTRTHDVDGSLYMVVNAAFKDKDYDLIEAACGGRLTIEPLEDRALLALQGPAAESVLSQLIPGAADLDFMEATAFTLEGTVCWVSRSGYTGEDGFEISVPEAQAEALARRLLAFPEVEMIGLGARDSLRLEVGLCLSGHDFDGSVNPVEASLEFALSKKRREAADFAGAEPVLDALSKGADKRRVGLRIEGRAPAREGAAILDEHGTPVGQVTSGGFGPSVGAPIAMGYVPAALAAPGTKLLLDIRGKHHSAHVAEMPFVPQRYKRKSG